MRKTVMVMASAQVLAKCLRLSAENDFGQRTRDQGEDGEDGREAQGGKGLRGEIEDVAHRERVSSRLVWARTSPISGTKGRCREDHSPPMRTAAKTRRTPTLTAEVASSQG